MKCRRCREPAVIELRRHNAAFCADCFVHHVRQQVRKAIDEFDMLHPGERVLVAVSGGKDSLGLWDVLLDLGYAADGLYLGLGIGSYSAAYPRSRSTSHRPSESLPPDTATRTRSPVCSMSNSSIALRTCWRTW